IPSFASRRPPQGSRSTAGGNLKPGYARPPATLGVTHPDCRAALNVKSYDGLVEIMHVNGRLMPGHQPMREAPETRALVRQIFRPAAQPK
ncbi:MAG: hypothetical protein ACREFP_23000, partial [Acetobacteraceae bacterium]